MPEVAAPQRLAERATEVAGQITNMLIERPFTQFEKILPGVDLNAIKQALTADVAQEIERQIGEGAEESILEALSTVPGFRTFLEKGGLIASSTMSLDEAQSLMGRRVIGPEAYLSAFKAKSVGDLPELPAILTADLLNSRCPIVNDGRSIRETHRLALVPASIDGEPLTLNSLRELTRGAGKLRDPSFLDQNWYRKEAFANAALESTWVLAPTLLGARDRSDREQLAVLDRFPEYRTAKVLELVAPMVMNYLQNSERINQYYYGRCEERTALGARVFAGRFGTKGLSVSTSAHGDFDRSAELGRAIVRKF